MLHILNVQCYNISSFLVEPVGHALQAAVHVHCVYIKIMRPVYPEGVANGEQFQDFARFLRTSTVFSASLRVSYIMALQKK